MAASLNVTPAMQTQVAELYAALVGRAPDSAGFGYWVNLMATNNLSLADVANAMYNTDAARAVYPLYLTNQQIISSFYTNVLGRTADAAGLTYWTGILNSNQNVGATVAAMINSVVAYNGTDAAALASQALFNNKVTVGVYFATVAQSNDLNLAANVFAELTAGQTVAQVEASLATNVGQTFTLTTGADNIVGTTVNDTINGFIDTTTAANSTLNVADQINAGAGTDTLNVTVSGAGTALNNSLPAATYSGIETLNVHDVQTGAAGFTVDASLMPGVTSVNADRATDAITVNNLAAGASVGVIGNGTVANANVTANYVAAATAATVNVSNGTTAGAVTVTGLGLTSATINSTGAANTLGGVALAAGVTAATINAATNLTTGGITGGALATITVTGAASSVNLSNLAGTVTKVDASAMTAGGVTATLDAALTSFKGGAGNDTVTTTTLTATTAGEVDAGAGTGDRLVVAAAADVSTATKGAEFVNFEILQNAAAGASIDASNIAGIVAVEANAAGATTFTNLSATQAGAVTVLQNAAALTLSLKDATGSSDVVHIDFGNGSTTAATPDVTGALTVNGFETVNLVAHQGTTVADKDVVIGSFAADSATALNLTGTSFDLQNVGGFSKAVTIDGSALTGYLKIDAGALIKGSVVTGSAQADTIVTAQAAGTTGDFVTYNAGAGDDSISTTAAALNNTSSAHASLKIDGGAGTDTLHFTDGGVTLVDANFQYVTNFEKIAIDGAGAVNLVSGGFFDTNFKAAGVTITDAAVGDNAATVDLTSFTGNATVSLTTGATTNSTVVNGGSGSDTITVAAAALTTGNVTVAAGAGNDTINVTAAVGATGTVTVDGGAGQDTITLTTPAAGVVAVAHTIVTEHAGHSTLAAADSITGFTLGGAGNVGVELNFDNAAVAAANIAAQSVTGYTAAQLTYTINGGLLTFAGTSASALTVAQEAAIAQQVVGVADTAVVFTNGTDSYVFEHNTSGDSLVKLVGVSATGLGAGDFAAGHVNIA